MNNYLLLFKNISYEKMEQLIEGMKTNTYIQVLSLSNIEMPDSVGKVCFYISI